MCNNRGNEFTLEFQFTEKVQVFGSFLVFKHGFKRIRPLVRWCDMMENLSTHSKVTRGRTG